MYIHIFEHIHIGPPFIGKNQISPEKYPLSKP